MQPRSLESGGAALMLSPKSVYTSTLLLLQTKMKVD
jgi:hypothetical protein